MPVVFEVVAPAFDVSLVLFLRAALALVAGVLGGVVVALDVVLLLVMMIFPPGLLLLCGIRVVGLSTCLTLLVQTALPLSSRLVTWPTRLSPCLTTLCVPVHVLLTTWCILALTLWVARLSKGPANALCAFDELQQSTGLTPPSTLQQVITVQVALAVCLRLSSVFVFSALQPILLVTWLFSNLVSCLRRVLPAMRTWCLLGIHYAVFRSCLCGIIAIPSMGLYRGSDYTMAVRFVLRTVAVCCLVVATGTPGPLRFFMTWLTVVRKLLPDMNPPPRCVVTSVVLP